MATEKLIAPAQLFKLKVIELKQAVSSLQTFLPNLLTERPNTVAAGSDYFHVNRKRYDFSNDSLYKMMRDVTSECYIYYSTFLRLETELGEFLNKELELEEHEKQLRIKTINDIMTQTAIGQPSARDILTIRMKKYLEFDLPKKLLNDKLSQIDYKITGNRNEYAVKNPQLVSSAAISRYNRQIISAINNFRNNKETLLPDALSKLREDCSYIDEEIQTALATHHGIHDKEEHKYLNYLLSALREIRGILALVLTSPARIVNNKGVSEYVGSYFKHPKTASEIKRDKFITKINTFTTTELGIGRLKVEMPDKIPFAEPLTLTSEDSHIKKV